MKHDHLAWAEIDLKAIRANYRAIRRLALKNFVKDRPPRQQRPFKKGGLPQVLCVVKADGYGHGMVEVASALKSVGVNFWGVADIPEGRGLRECGLRQPVLLLGTPLPSQAGAVLDHNLMPTVCTVALASALDRSAQQRNRTIDIHVKIDTGMGRLGICSPEAGDFIRRIVRFPRLRLRGLYTHFPMADTNPAFTRKQIRCFEALVDSCDRKGLVIPYIHCANSMGLAGYKGSIFNLVRPGLMLYGLYPSPSVKKKIRLQPAMAVKARIIFIKKIAKGEGVSYGHTFVAGRDRAVAILPIGYNDGYFRAFSNKSCVLIGGRRCPVLGRVTMDQIIVDVSRVRAPKVGMTATLLGQDGRERVTADDLARLAGTISYEIVCGLGNRLPRVYKK